MHTIGTGLNEFALGRSHRRADRPLRRVPDAPRADPRRYRRRRCNRNIDLQTLRCGEEQVWKRLAMCNILARDDLGV